MDHAPKSVASQSLPSSAAAAAAAATSASSASASSVATIAAAVAASSQKHKENHKIRSDILDDLSSRFIINVPVAERSDFIRISFQIELAHWFYLDFYCSAEDTRLVPCGIKQFAFHIFHHIPFLKVHLPRLNDILTEFKAYKMSVPTYGAVLMTADQQRVLLVQSYFAKSSWGFPKGKVNEDEEPLHCAIREVYEETGFDISNIIRPDDYVEGVLNYQFTRLYVVRNVPEDTVFVPRTRMEIKSCNWFRLDLLPTHKMDPVCREQLGINANSFFMIMPFVKRLKRWVSENRNGGGAGRTSVTKNATNGHGGNNANGGQLQQQQQQQQQKQQQQNRQRHKSLGDLDGMKTNTPNSVAVAAPSTSSNVRPQPTTTTTAKPNRNGQQQQSNASIATTMLHNSNPSNNTKQQHQRVPQPSTSAATAAAVVVMPSPAVAANDPASKSSSNSTTKAANFKRQLFTLQQQQQQLLQSATAQHTSNPLAVVQQIIAVGDSMPTQAHQTLEEKTAAANTTITTRPTILPKKRRPITSFLNGLNGDPALQKWRQFAFVTTGPALLSPWPC